MALAINNLTSKSNSNTIPNYTVSAGSGLILIVMLGMSFADDNASGTVKYGGVDLTKAVSELSPDDGTGYHYLRSEIWYLLNPTVGTATMVVTSGDNTEQPVIIGYISGADIGSVGNTGVNNALTGTSETVDITPAQADSLLIGCFKTENSGASQFSAGANTTLNRQQTNADGTVAFASRAASSTSPHTLALTATSGAWAAAALEIKAAAAAGTAVKDPIRSPGVVPFAR